MIKLQAKEIAMAILNKDENTEKNMELALIFLFNYLENDL